MQLVDHSLSLHCATAAAAAVTGVPTALRFMPGMLDAVKGAVKREAAQLLDKVYYVAQKVSAEAPDVQHQSMAAMASGPTAVVG